MEAQYHTIAPHHDPFYTSSTPYPLHSDQYLATAGGVDFAPNFLGGSSPPYPDPHEHYRYAFHRGPESSSYRAETTSISNGLGATGLGFSGCNTTPPALLVNNLFPPEELTLYTGQPWSWTGPQAQAQASIHGVVAPVPVLPSPPEVTFLPLKTQQVSPPSSFVRSGDPPLPTPAAMAVLLSSGTSHSEAQSPFAVPSSVVDIQGVSVGAQMTGTMGLASSQPGSLQESTSREKKHACTMCHKRFDRPSTLRKHLLVHTGEKAFVCDICGRRFGVASNLNRHVKRCALKPVNMTVGSPPKSDSPSSADEISPQTSPITQSPEHSLARSPLIAHKRGSISSVSSSTSTVSTASSSRGRSSMSPLQIHSRVPTTMNLVNGISTGTKTTTQKRRRRAPSPSRWVPLSLVNFNLTSEDMHRSTCIPLAPVRPNRPREERDSWDENVSPTPYHPRYYKGVMPGPGLLHQGGRGKELGRLQFGGGGGGGGGGGTVSFMVNRLVAI